MGEVIGRAAN